MKRFGYMCLVALLGLSACAAQQAKDAAMSSPLVMSQSENLQRQRPRLPNTDSVAWTRDDRLYRSVTLDYVKGMSQRSYVMSKPNQEVYREMLNWSLARANLLAETPVEARYALQVEFSDLDTEAFGADFAGRSQATYRIIDRWNGNLVYENTVGSYFLAIYPRLNEDDFATAIEISKKAVTTSLAAYAGYAIVEGGLKELINNNDDFRDFFDDHYDEASQATWNEVNQAFVWTTGIGALLGPLEVARQQLDPTNYIAFANHNGRASTPLEGVRRGALETQGFGSRSGGKRARQASAQMLAQSLTKFVIDLGREEDIDFKVILPCNGNADVEEMKLDLMKQGVRWYAPDCSFRDDRNGLQFTRLE